jgi:hypothetical protein
MDTTTRYGLALTWYTIPCQALANENETTRFNIIKLIQPSNDCGTTAAIAAFAPSRESMSDRTGATERIAYIWRLNPRPLMNNIHCCNEQASIQAIATTTTTTTKESACNWEARGDVAAVAAAAA